jgi:TetR/AcrR family transcriptional regulator, cholesterol catabolism regulator
LFSKIVSIVLRRQMEIRDRIKQKAEELFRKYGIRSITMDEIASQLGVSKKTIYQYFADKHQLVEAVITDIIKSNQQDCITYSEQSTNAVHEVFLLMDLLKRSFEDLNPTVFYDMQRSHPKAYEKFMAHKNGFILNSIRRNLDRGVEEGFYRDDMDHDVISRLRLETMMLAFNTELFPKSKVNLLNVEQQLIEHFLYGIANLKGHKMIIKYQEDRFKKQNQDGKVK